MVVQDLQVLTFQKTLLLLVVLFSVIVQVLQVLLFQVVLLLSVTMLSIIVQVLKQLITQELKNNGTQLVRALLGNTELTR